MYRVILVLLVFFIGSSPSFSADYKKVALVSVSSKYNVQKVDKIKESLTECHYQVSTKYLNQFVSDFGYVGSDRSRAKHLIDALLDDDIDVVWFVLGGGGAMNLLPYLEQAHSQLVKAKPKIIVGFSDVTAIHNYLNEKLGWNSLHGVVAMLNANVLDTQVDPSGDSKPRINDMEPIPNIDRIHTDGIYYDQILPMNQAAEMTPVEGVLVGGNHTLVAATIGTRFSPDFNGKVLFLEDVGVSYRQLDRSLQQLLFLNDFNVSGIVFGQYYPLEADDANRLIYKTVIAEFAKKFNKPVYYYPAIGHGRENHPLILGSGVSLQCDDGNEYCALEQKIN
ncbi:LD-carboxypeptidase [Vibrio tetraodonis]|uniref:LD-carboxypeptidase n=1 Tax=Vibrio tetraodonis TaxID=2231647 RepID=UPI000E0A6A73|nr:LD-carboxypeptidase [Vibrio tetraodonis]